MSDDMSDDLDFDAWLDGASLATVSVELLQNPSLLSEYEDWERRYLRAKTAPKVERSAADPDPVTALLAEGEELLARLEAARTVWHVRALTGDDRDAIMAAFPNPPAPEGFKENPPRVVHSPTEAQAKAFSQGYEAYRERERRWVDAHHPELEAYGEAVKVAATLRGAEELARAVVRVKQAGRVIAERITAEQAMQLAGKIGEAQLNVLVEAVNRACREVPEVPVGPLSHGSGDDPE